MDAESFGAKIIVSSRSENGLAFTGHARLSNVEFVNTGQEGYLELDDARFSITYSDTGTVSSIKPSYVKECAFHDGFSPAIGLFGANGMIIENNVIHHTVKHAIWTTSVNTTIHGNLTVLNIWTESYQAAIEAMEATDLTLVDNSVSASERMCYHVPGTECDSGITGKYVNNIGHSCLIGTGLFSGNADAHSCTRLANFSLWKNHEYGLYYNNFPNTKLTDNVFIENGMNIFSMVVGPSSLDHQYENKFAYVTNTFVMGRTSSFTCSDNGLLSPPGIINGGMVGLTWTTFTSGSNNAPVYPLAGIMAYQAIGGTMRVSDVTFAYFQTSCTNQTDFAITTNEGNDDGNHPLIIESATLEFVDDTLKVFIHRPNTEKINPGDCVDMDCDAKKKTIMTDLDGSFLGKQASIISQSEFEWDVNPLRGLGDYRIPKELLTDPVTGTRLSVNSIAKKRGQNFDVFFTSTSPQHSRYLMLGASESQAVRVCVY